MIRRFTIVAILAGPFLTTGVLAAPDAETKAPVSEKAIAAEPKIELPPKKEESTKREEPTKKEELTKRDEPAGEKAEPSAPMNATKAFDKSVAVLAKSLGGTKLSDAQQIKVRHQIDTFRSCHDLSDTNLLSAWAMPYNKEIMVIATEGEQSGKRVILGRNCDNSVSYNFLSVIQISYFVEKAFAKGGPPLAVKGLVPIGHVQDRKGQNLTYQVDLGTLSLSTDSAHSAKTTLIGKDNKPLFVEEFETVINTMDVK